MSVDCPQLDGDGYAFTLTIRDIPPTADAYTAAIKRFMQRLREEEFLRWHRVIELTKRRRPHLHGSVYFRPGWTPSGSPISDIMSSNRSRPPLRDGQGSSSMGEDRRGCDCQSR